MGAVIGFPNEGIPGRIIVGRIMGEATEDLGLRDSAVNHSTWFRRFSRPSPPRSPRSLR